MRSNNLGTSGNRTPASAASVAREVIVGLAVGLVSVALIAGFAIGASTFASVAAPIMIMLSTGVAVAAAFAGVRTVVRRQSRHADVGPARWAGRYA